MTEKDKLLSSREVQDVLNLIDDGFLFERFGQGFLSARLGYRFLASGGIKDRGIDGLEYASELEDNKKAIFQLSIDKNPEAKIKDTVEKLNTNNIEFSRLTYVTNIELKNKDELIDQYLDEHNIALRIFDGTWIADNANNSSATTNTIYIFVRDNLRRYQKPGEGVVVHDYVKDPRLYVFLKQQISKNDEIADLNNNLIDSLILYALRDTNPDDNSLLSSEEIADTVKSLVNFEIERIQSKINKRLKSLTKKPNRRVNHHTDIERYCLPYETRLEILTSNARDVALYDAFHKEAIRIIKNNLDAESVHVRSVSNLLDKTLEKVYYKQGLDFSDFLLNSGCDESFETSLSDTVNDVVDSASITGKNKQKVKNVLIVSIRDIIYHGSPESKEYLKSLSKTYLMLFLLKCEPRIVSYFQSMASQMSIFVCTSILVPALSEIYLEPQNQRYWSLLKAAKSRGVGLLVNDTIISELEFHIQRSLYIYEEEYDGNIDFYRDDVEELIDQILVRAYIYAFKEGKTSSYRGFIENFITPDGGNTKQELIDFLHEEFGIDYINQSELDIELDSNEYQRLVEELTVAKKSEEKAKTDANLILTIYALRKMRGEEKSSLDGYKTWWLSSDTVTHRTVSDIFKGKYPVSCYMRPDFLYNYISFTPPIEAVKQVYKDTFPNLLGVQISNHIPRSISSSIRGLIKEHSDKLDGRVKAQIRSLIDDLKTNPNLDIKERLTGFFS
ncbi:MAG: hypothetical protein AB2552_10470 [Candidatus Thiodiazotropha endolucinida]